MTSLGFSLPNAVTVAIGVLASLLVTGWVARHYFRKASAENTNMLRPLAHFIEQLSTNLGL